MKPKEAFNAAYIRRSRLDENIKPASVGKLMVIQNVSQAVCMISSS